MANLAIPAPATAATAASDEGWRTTFAGYNAGPNRVNRLRELTGKQGPDPNEWLHTVEIVVAKKVGRETTQYVGDIHEYYIACKRIAAEMAVRPQVRDAFQKN